MKWYFRYTEEKEGYRYVVFNTSGRKSCIYYKNLKEVLREHPDAELEL